MASFPPDEPVDVQYFTLDFGEAGIFHFASWEHHGETMAAIIEPDTEDSETIVPGRLDDHLRTCEGCQADLALTLSKHGYRLCLFYSQQHATQ